MKPYADYYSQLDFTHQRQIDYQAGYEIALAEEIERVRQEAEREDDDVIQAINEYYLDNSEELELHDLAFGSGAFDELVAIRDRAIRQVAANRIDERMNDYNPD